LKLTLELDEFDSEDSIAIRDYRKNTGLNLNSLLRLGFGFEFLNPSFTGL
jgi:hypothetical protein